jgi:S-adenosylmethionine/arginine decarboxylase-like enzyme
MDDKMWSNSGWITETNPEILKNKYDKKLEEAGFKVIGFIEHFFEPQGYTALWLLSESHFALHTFPENNSTYYELSSCINTQFDKFII